ncbi:MAG TPA: hypothetical protein VLW51_04340 [Solirubrobacteraceae bacterium]|nr:hypothetical protein [Solirubrobacteraceae bacterium]
MASNFASEPGSPRWSATVAVEAVELADGERVAADVVVVGLGVGS